MKRIAIWALVVFSLTACGTSRSNLVPTSNYAFHSLALVSDTVSIKTYPLPSGTFPQLLALDSAGNVWFTGTPNKVGFLVPSTGNVTQFSIPVGYQPRGITLGPDCKIWFVEPFGTGDHVVRVTDTGQFKLFLIPGSKNEAESIGTAADHNLWIPQGGLRVISRMTTAEPSRISQ